MTEVCHKNHGDICSVLSSTRTALFISKYHILHSVEYIVKVKRFKGQITVFHSF